MSDPVAWWWPVVVFGGLVQLGRSDPARFGRPAALAQCAAMLVVAGVFIAVAVYLTANNEAGWYSFGAGAVFLILALGALAARARPAPEALSAPPLDKNRAK